MWRSAVGFIITATLVAPPAASAQQSANVPYVIVLQAVPKGSAAHINKAFEDKLGELGYVNGRNIRMEIRRGTDATPAGMSEAAVQVVAAKPDLIVVWGTVGAFAVKKATSTIPVVFLAVGFPVDSGLASSLRRAGGTITGVAYEASVETSAKRLELLKEALPALRRAGGLMRLGANMVEVARMGASYVDKILKGANPADLPVEQPDRYELHINLKTAKALGITFPQSINVRADEAIE